MLATAPCPWHCYRQHLPTLDAAQAPPPFFTPPLTELVPYVTPPAEDTSKSQKTTKITFDTFLDAINSPKLSSNKKSSASSSSSNSSNSSVEEIPRVFPPPGYYYYWPGPGGSGPPVFSPEPPPFQPHTATKPDLRPHLDGHIHSSEANRKRDSQKGKRATSEIVLKHYCAKCGRPRSKGYQRDNPVKPGVIPVPGICSRCQPSDSDDDNTDNDCLNDLPSKSPKTKVAAPPPEIEEVEEILVHRGSARQSTATGKHNKADTFRVRVGRPRSRGDIRTETRQRAPSSESSTLANVADEDSDDVDEPRAPREPSPPLKSKTIYKYILVDREEDKASTASPNPSKIRKPPPRERRMPLEQENIAVPEPPIEREQSPIRININVRTNHVPLDEQDEPSPAGQRNTRDVDRLIASHPNAWSHGEMLEVQRTPTAKRANQQTRAPPTQASSRSSSPPEWYYRYNRRRVVSSVDSSTKPPPPRSLVSPAPTLERSPPLEPSRRRPLRGILQQTTREEPYESHRLYYHHVSESDDEEEPSSRVTFAAGTKVDGQGRGRPRTDWSSNRDSSIRRHDEIVEDWSNPLTRWSGSKEKAVRRQDEAVEDWEEARHDQHDFEKAKLKVRHRVHKGAGAFELDGHRSEETEKPGDSTDFLEEEATPSQDVVHKAYISPEVSSEPRLWITSPFYQGGAFDGSVVSCTDPIAPSKSDAAAISRTRANTSLPAPLISTSLLINHQGRPRSALPRFRPTERSSVGSTDRGRSHTPSTASASASEVFSSRSPSPSLPSLAFLKDNSDHEETASERSIEQRMSHASLHRLTSSTSDSATSPPPGKANHVARCGSTYDTSRNLTIRIRTKSRASSKERTRSSETSERLGRGHASPAASVMAVRAERHRSPTWSQPSGHTEDSKASRARAYKLAVTSEMSDATEMLNEVYAVEVEVRADQRREEPA